MAQPQDGSSSSPVPSITLQITKRDAERFLEASAALREEFETRQHLLKSSDSASSDEKKENEDSAADRTETQPLHELLYDSAKSCNHPLVTSFLERMSAASLPLAELKMSVLLFLDENKTAKLRHYFSALAADAEQLSLNRQGALSLFRSVLTSIACCVHTPDSQGKEIVVEGKPSATSSPSDEPPKKRVKREEDTVSTKPSTADDQQEFRACQSPSFDSSMATLRDEDEKESASSLQREVEDIASYAADELIKFATEKAEGAESVDFATFGDWYNSNGSKIVPWLELVQHSKWKAPGSSKPTPKPKQTKDEVKQENAMLEQEVTESPASLMTEETTSRSLVSFDFSGSDSPVPLLVSITEDNLFVLRHLVQRTGLIQRPAADACKILLRSVKAHHGDEVPEMLTRESFRRALEKLIPGFGTDSFSTSEREAFSSILMDFFSSFEPSVEAQEVLEVNLKQFAIGFCFFCGGNKSAKLATGFELLAGTHDGLLSEDQLSQYLQSYLTILVGMSFLTPISNSKTRRPLSRQRRNAIRSAVDAGTKWTLRHFFKSMDEDKRQESFSFETFASWYSTGGYNIAPWLELLDLKKVLSLIEEPVSSPVPLPPLNTTVKTAERRPVTRDRVSTLRRHHSRRKGPPPEVLFTFPLAHRRSLVVLRDDASYVRGVVEQLGLLSMKPDEVWSALSQSVDKLRRNVRETIPYVDLTTFVQSMQEICPKLSRKRQAPGMGTSAEELLSNFFHCFDIDRADRVALDELMGGLTLLCGGKKSTKLSFAFGVFDTRPGVNDKRSKEAIVHSLSGEDLFLFLRSILIVTFSCCCQSLDMTDEQVGRCIADTANMICNDVMRHQWETKQLDRLNFDEFGQWYNDGGFERAPWLELLDLRKWVLLDGLEAQERSHSNSPPRSSSRSRHVPPPLPPPKLEAEDPAIPPPPPEDALDSSFFDENVIMPMDSMDEMDMILMQPSTDKETDLPESSPKLSKSYSFSPEQPKRSSKANALKFHLATKDREGGGYMLSLSQARIRHFRRILEASALHTIDAETACNNILAKASRSKISRDAFDTVMRDIVDSSHRQSFTSSMKRVLYDLFADIFTAFDRDNIGKANAIELACGFTVLCRGKKSDKLEFAFEVLDKNKRGQLSRADTANYLRSFLSVLLSIAFLQSLDSDPADDFVTTLNHKPCERSIGTVIRVGEAGADWAASLAFSDFDSGKKGGKDHSMSFDDFADWYTSVGYSSIPWLELLDLHKWVLTP